MALNHLSRLRPLLCQSLVRQLRSPLAAASRVSAAPRCPPGIPCYPAACTRLYATKKAKGQWGDHRHTGLHMRATSGCALYLIRHYLSSSSSLSPSLPLIFQAKAKGQSAKVNINSALVEDIISLDEVKADMSAVLNALKDDFTRNLSIRTSPGIEFISLLLFLFLVFSSKTLKRQRIKDKINVKGDTRITLQLSQVDIWWNMKWK